MGKAMYLGVSSKARKSKKAYIGVSGKARKIKKMYIGDANGKARLFWSGTNAAKLVVALSDTHEMYSDYSHIFTADDYKNIKNITVTALSVANSGVCQGYILGDKYLFPSNGCTYYCTADGTEIVTLEKSTNPSRYYRMGLDSSNNTLYTVHRSELTTGGGPGGSGGVVQFFLQSINEDLEVSSTQLVQNYPPMDTNGTRPSFSWSKATSGDESNYYSGNASIYNNKAYVVLLSYTQTGGSGSSAYPYLYVIDLNTKTLKKVCDIGAQLSYTGYCIRDVNKLTIAFSDGLLMFVNHSIYKLNSDGASVSKLVDVNDASFYGGYYSFDNVIRISETKFLITYFKGGSISTAYCAKLYEFKNGALTLLNTLAVGSDTNKAVLVDDALIIIHTSPNSNDLTYLEYSLDYGVTWTRNNLNNGDLGISATAGTRYHTVAGKIF